MATGGGVAVHELDAAGASPGKEPGSCVGKCTEDQGGAS
jgi:hypothetical protein